MKRSDGGRDGRRRLVLISSLSAAEFATNRSFTGNFHSSPQYRQARATLMHDIRQQYHDGPLPYRVRIEILIYDVEIDSDAPIKGIIDALKRARVIEDDDRVHVSGCSCDHAEGGEGIRISLVEFP